MKSENKRMGLETTTLSDATQAQKVKYITREKTLNFQCCVFYLED